MKKYENHRKRHYLRRYVLCGNIKAARHITVHLRESEKNHNMIEKPECRIIMQMEYKLQTYPFVYGEPRRP